MAAEGLGLAASVAGLVSLGLQITGGVVNYLDAVDRREDDLAHLRQQNQALTVTLLALETMAAGLQIQQLAFSGTLVQNLQRCKNALGDAEKLRIELTDDKNTTWTTRLGNTKKKLTYKFQEPKIQQLSHRLQRTNEVLNLTLTGLGVETSMLNATKLTAIELSSQGMASELHQINSRIEAVREPSIQINNNLPVLRDSVSSVAHLVEHRSGLILDEIQQSGQNVQEEIRSSMQSQFKQQQDEFDKKFGQLFEMLQRPHPTTFVAPSALQELCDSTQSHKHRRKRDSPAEPVTSVSRSAVTVSALALGGEPPQVVYRWAMHTYPACRKLKGTGRAVHIQSGRQVGADERGV
ncbi:hypothetical protein E8E14_002565 [Neopestalotiopsis sp. 37M]|nr:hypothetical protein E8E14_002565 [Neopestalotiopsis sp. 37M]